MDIRPVSSLLLAALLVLGGPASSPGQYDGEDDSSDVSVMLIPQGGAYLPGVSDLGGVTGSLEAVTQGDDYTVVAGGSVQFASPDGPLNVRLSGMKTTSSLISIDGMDGDAVAKDDLLALGADLLLRPIPRFLIQPYLIGGAAGLRETLATRSGGETTRTEEWKLAGKAGLGLDLRLGTRGVIVSAEIVDYVSNIGGDGDLSHDAVVVMGLGLPLF